MENEENNNDSSFELDNSFRTFRRFLHKIKTADADKKASLLANSIEQIDDIVLFKNILTLVIYCFLNPEDRIDPQKLDDIKFQIQNIQLSSTSSLTIAESLSDACSLSKCTEVDAKF